MEFDRELLTDRIYKVLKSRIINREYLPGFRLKTEKIAKEFKVSAIPIREVFKLLKASGFIEIIPHKGAEVINFKDPKHIQNLCEVRTMIECFAVEKVIKMVNFKIIKNLEVYLNKMKDAAEKKDVKIDIYDYNFHKTIIEASNNPYLINIFDNIHFQIPSLINDKNNYKEHQSIFDCIVNKDLKGAKKAIIENIMINVKKSKLSNSNS